MSKQDEHKKISDLFSTGFENVSNEGLVHKLNQHSGTTAQDSIKLEMNRRLIDSINEFNKISSKQSEKMVKLNKQLVILTRWIVGLTMAMIVLLIFQIYSSVQQGNEVIKQEERTADATEKMVESANLPWIWILILVIIVIAIGIVLNYKRSLKKP